jgi:hypothetical protein
MYACKVGSDFKVGFLKRSLNFCYDQNEGVIYTSDLETLEKLGVDKDKINEAFKKEDEKIDVEYEDKKIDVEYENKEHDLPKPNLEEILTDLTKSLVANFNDQISSVEQRLLKKIEVIEKEKVLLERTIRELVDFYKEGMEVEDEKEKNQNESFSTVKNSIGILNKKIKDSNESIQNLKIRFEAVLDILSEHSAKTGQLPNILKNGITLEKIWSSVQDKKSAAILSIMLMMKKALEEKGMRLTA